MPRRCFLAITVPTAPTRTITRACRAFRDAAPAWVGEKWVRPESLHLTLRFIGAIADASLPDALSALSDTCSAHPGHHLHLDGVRAVPAPRRASMLWATYGGDVDTSASLARDIGATLERVIGLDPDPRAFRPHTTLVRARAQRRAPLPALRAAGEVLASSKETDRSMSVLSVTLFESTLGPDGPHYAVLGSFPLAR